MRKITRLALLVLLAALSLTGMAADWPQFLGPFANGFAPDKGINKDWATKPPKLLWQVPLTDGGFDGPAVANGALYIIDHKDQTDLVRALDVQSGAQLWTFEYENLTKSNYGFTKTTPAVVGDNVYVVSQSGMLYCLKAKSGEKLWSRSFPADFAGKKPGWDYAQSPLVDGDKLIVSPCGPDAALVALNRHTGEVLWKGGGSFPGGYATPARAAILGKFQYVHLTNDHVIGVDAATGALLWKYPWQTTANIPTPLVMGSYIYLTCGYNRGCAMLEITMDGPKLLWENKGASVMSAHINSPIYYHGYIYGNSDPGFLVCVEPSTGKLLWKQAGFEKGGVVGVDGVLIAMNGRGGDAIMVQMSPEGYQELGRFTPLGGQSWTPPVIADGKLIIRNTKTLACFDLK